MSDDTAEKICMYIMFDVIDITCLLFPFWLERQLTVYVLLFVNEKVKSFSVLNFIYYVHYKL